MIFLQGPFPEWASNISQRYGVNPKNYGGVGHEGVDLRVLEETPIQAMHSGHVTLSGIQSMYGEVITVSLGAYATTYAHLSKRLVTIGQHVKAGQVIGLSGNTGNSTGPHLHLGLRFAGYDYDDGWYGYSNPEPALADLLALENMQKEKNNV